MAIINIVDATNIERNLYLTLQLMELNIPMVLALNMMDEVRASEQLHRCAKDSREELGVAGAFPSPPAKNEGISDLLDDGEQGSSRMTKRRRRLDFCTRRGAPGHPLHCPHRSRTTPRPPAIPLRFAATKLVEGDEPMHRSPGGSAGTIPHHRPHRRSEMEQRSGHRPGGRPGGYAVQLYRADLRRSGSSNPAIPREQLRSVQDRPAC